MADLAWHDFLKIGVDFIDEDHKKLLNIMLETKAAITKGDTQKCVILLTSLLKEAKNHFSREETYLLEVKYPGLEEHKKYHKELLLKAENIKRICEGIETEHDLMDCFDGMSDFLIDDILKGDIMFKSYLEYHGHIEK
jgi:hemerythrin-like metal-binding protein